MRYLESTNVWNREIIGSEAATRVLGIALFVVLTALGAFVRIPLPFTPVPITGQTFFVILSGLFLKRYDGAISQLVYVSLGLIGLPIFAGASGGASTILGPTGGYLIAFIIAPTIVSLSFKSLKISNAYLRAMSALSLGVITIHALGIINLASFLNIGLYKAFLLGSLPFIAGAAIKVVVGAKVYATYKKHF